MQLGTSAGLSHFNYSQLLGAGHQVAFEKRHIYDFTLRYELQRPSPKIQITTRPTYLNVVMRFTSSFAVTLTVVALHFGASTAVPLKPAPVG